MNAIVTVEFTIRNICSKEDVEASGLTFEELVESLISEEGLLSLCADSSTVIVAVEEA